MLWRGHGLYDYDECSILLGEWGYASLMYSSKLTGHGASKGQGRSLIIIAVLKQGLTNAKGYDSDLKTNNTLRCTNTMLHAEILPLFFPILPSVLLVISLLSFPVPNLTLIRMLRRIKHIYWKLQKHRPFENRRQWLIQLRRKRYQDARALGVPREGFPVIATFVSFLRPWTFLKC